MDTLSQNKKKIFIGIIIFLVIVLVFLLIIKDNKEKENKPEEPEATEKPLEKGTYITEDRKFTLKIVEKDDSEAKKLAKQRYGEKNFDEIILPFVKKYAYFNDQILAIDSVKEDENYAVYGFVGLETEVYGNKILVNKTNNRIEVSNSDLNKVGVDCLNEGFCGFQSFPSYIRVSTGYFFTTSDNGLTTVYTTSWEKLGYIESVDKAQTDNDGIYVYGNVERSSCYGDYCDYSMVGQLVKYDINGKRK